MRFINLGLVALSTIFATSLAAPAAHDIASPGELVSAEVDVDVLDSRAPQQQQQVVLSKIQTTVVEVKKHTSVINSTVAGVCGTCIAQKKESVIALVKGEVTIIVGLVHALAGDVVGLLSGTVEVVEEEKQKIVAVVIELILEIAYTLKNVLKVLSIGIFELLGPLVFVLLTVVGHLLCALNVLVDGLLQLVFAFLGGVVGLLLEVLRGLLPTVLGLVGDVLDKLNLGGLICGLLN
ncbi:hypothetical protein Cob_v011255 [Colletotrichum orbiculare MAFF 240422]|uniref:Uncharacterized protein n=1 Tax=Colletotrichum orbiculare (strain 104-T / ATCC 96160 / CBS 514.97 / LARS 414 / MAFF 240422) TaxID=1213857 RepID=N4UMT0_COLOR|nr:hypothetical protein Cob_v011255 [Colletotrichum orbiculare MAFF 240422]